MSFTSKIHPFSTKSSYRKDHVKKSSILGVNVIEEGFLGGKAIKLKTMHKVSIDNHDKHFITVSFFVFNFDQASFLGHTNIFVESQRRT